MPGLYLAGEILRPPAMTLVQSAIVFAPACASATSTEQRRIVIAGHHRFGDASTRQAVALERTACTIPRLGAEKASVLERLSGTQNLAPWTLHDVVAEAACGYAALDGFLFRRDQWIDPTARKPAIDLGVGIAGIGRRNRATRDLLRRLDLGLNQIASFIAPVVTATSSEPPPLSHHRPP